MHGLAESAPDSLPGMVLCLVAVVVADAQLQGNVRPKSGILHWFHFLLRIDHWFLSSQVNIFRDFSGIIVDMGSLQEWFTHLRIPVNMHMKHQLAKRGAQKVGKPVILHTPMI